MSETPDATATYNFDSVEAIVMWLEDNPSEVLKRINRLIHTQAFDQADHLGAIAVRLFPDNQSIGLEYALVPMFRPDYAAAAVRLAELQDRFPYFARAWSYGARALRGGRRFDEAEALLERATAKFPGEWHIFVEYGHCASDRRALQEAIVRWAIVRQRFPQRPEGYWMAARVLSHIGDLDQAELIIGQAIDRFPDNRLVLRQWVVTAIDRQDWPEVERRWAVAKSRHPDMREGDVGYIRRALARPAR